METLTETNITRLKIDNIDVFLEEFSERAGKITISDVYGHNYSYYWGAMGYPLPKFLCSIDEDYFAKNLIGNHKSNVMDVKRTFTALRKYIRKELGLHWHMHMEFQKDLRQVLNNFQRQCEDLDDATHYFVDMFYYDFVNRLDYSLINNRFDRKEQEDNFKIEEHWHFIVNQGSDKYIWLTKFHKKLKEKLSNAERIN